MVRQDSVVISSTLYVVREAMTISHLSVIVLPSTGFVHYRGRRRHRHLIVDGHCTEVTYKRTDQLSLEKWD